MTAQEQSLAPLTQGQLDRFWNKVDKNGPIVREELTPCWIWTAAKTQGYGHLTLNRKDYKAHRIAMFIMNGTDPFTGTSAHICDNPSCVNPDHIVIADQIFNMNECLVRGRMKHAFICGKFNHNAKLTDETVESIRESRRDGATQKSLAITFGVHVSTIKDLLHYRTWRVPSTKEVRSSTPKGSSNGI